MRTVWITSFALNTLGAGLCLYSGLMLSSDGLILLGAINTVYAAWSAHKVGQFNEL